MEELLISPGTVVSWHGEEGWGTILLDTVKVEAWAHFSSIDAPPGAYRSLDIGARVDCWYEWFAQDGFEARVVRVQNA